MDNKLVVFFGEKRRVCASSPDNILGVNHTPLEEASKGQAARRRWTRSSRHIDDDRDVPYWLTQTITAMSALFSTVVRRTTPSLRQQARPLTAAAAHTQTAAVAAAVASSSSPSKLDEGEQAIYDKLSERFQPSELLVQDVSGAPPSCPHPCSIFTIYSRYRWLWDLLRHYYCEQGI
jgi:hypothetical protein